jgi:hypothetical protein
MAGVQKKGKLTSGALKKIGKGPWIETFLMVLEGQVWRKSLDLKENAKENGMKVEVSRGGT